MAVNPLYQNGYYFFSGMYDDSLITDFYRKITSESFERSVQYQQNMLGRKRYSSSSDIFCKAKISDFVIDESYNTKYNLASGSRTIKFPTLIIPYHDKQRFVRKYGSKRQKIALTDFYKYPTIFDKVIILQIGTYRIMDACIIHNEDNTITLAIENSNTSGIPAQSFNRIIEEYENDEPVWIFSDEITSTYFADTSVSQAISTTVTAGNYDITIPKTSLINTIGTTIHEHANSWDCLITYNYPRFGKKVFASCPCTLKRTDENNAVFAVNADFIDFIKIDTSIFYIYFIYRPNRKYLYIYEYSTNTYPILNLEYSYNPTGNINIEVYEFDKSTMCKGRKLYNPQFTQLYFPNIFDFSALNQNHSDLMVELSEYDPTYTNQKMNNSIIPLITSLGNDFYTKFIVNEYDKSIGGSSCDLKHYSPKAYQVTMEDYLSSEYKGNYRGYILDKIEKTIKSDLYLLGSYYNWMNKINNRSITYGGTPKTFKFGTGKTGEFSGSNPIVMNTSETSIIDDDIQYFTEPHSYIIYHSDMNDIPSTIFINGKYIRPTCRRLYKGNCYIYFPVSKINNEMTKYLSDTELVEVSPITLDIFPDAYQSCNDVPKDMIFIDDLTSKIEIFQTEENRTFSLDELIVYDANSGEFLEDFTDLFSIDLSVSTYTIKNPESVEQITISRGKKLEVLLTLLTEIYRTMDEQMIIIGENSTIINWNDFIEDLLDSEVITEDEVDNFKNKKLNFEDIQITPKDMLLLGSTLVIYPNNFKSEYQVACDSGVYNSGTNKTTYILSGANIDPNMNMYWIFIDGKLNPTIKPISVDNEFKGSLKLELTGNWTSESKEILVVHMPVKYKTDNFNILSRVFYMKPAITSATTTANIWPERDTDGVILQYPNGDPYQTYPFEAACNMKFTSDGLRLPESKKSVNRIYGEYLSDTQAKAYNLSKGNTGYLLTINTDAPITKLATQNPYYSKYDSSLPTNPLDILTHVE